MLPELIKLVAEQKSNFERSKPLRAPVSGTTSPRRAAGRRREGDARSEWSGTAILCCGSVTDNAEETGWARDTRVGTVHVAGRDRPQNPAHTHRVGTIQREVSEAGRFWLWLWDSVRAECRWGSAGSVFVFVSIFSAVWAGGDQGAL